MGRGELLPRSLPLPKDFSLYKKTFFQKTLDILKKYGIIVKQNTLHDILKRRKAMFEKNLNIGFLLDFYGDVRTERRRTVLDYYYNDDLSLAEIADEIGISRQGVRDLIKKAEEELYFYEEKLGLAERFRRTRQQAEHLMELLKESGADGEVYQAAEELINSVR